MKPKANDPCTEELPSRNPSGSLVVTDGLTISDSVVVTVFLASGRDINVMVFDTEVYSNTGGQSSKSHRQVRSLSSQQAEKETRKRYGIYHQ